MSVLEKKNDVTKHGIYSFHLILFSNTDEMFELWLPRASEGIYSFSEETIRRYLCVKAIDGRWTAVCEAPAYFLGAENEQFIEAVLSDNQLLNIMFDEYSYQLYSETVFHEEMLFHNYAVQPNSEISIGKAEYNDICCFGYPQVCEKTAVLRYTNGEWSIQSISGSTGIYMGGKRILSQSLNIGDVIHIMGLCLIVGPSFLSINSGNRIKVQSRFLSELTQGMGYSRYYNLESGNTADRYYNRSPRKNIGIIDKTIEVEGPPMSMDDTQMPLMLRLGSSAIMAGNAALMGNYTMLLTSLMMPVLNSKYTEKQRKDYEALRVEKYREYLEQKRKEIKDECEEECIILREKYPSVLRIASETQQKKRLWERRPVNDDFLHVRLGSGASRMLAKLEYPKRRFELQTDKLEDEMYRLVEDNYILNNIPIVLSLIESWVCGLLGPRNKTLGFVAQMLLQIAVLHSYDEVKMVFLLNDTESQKLDFIKYLPHVWDNNENIRFVATSEADAYRVGEHIREQIVEDLDSKVDMDTVNKTRPYYLVFALDKKLFESHEVFKDILGGDGKHGVSVIAVYDELPKETSRIITLNDSKQGVLTNMDVNGGEDIPFTPDYFDAERTERLVREISNTRLKTITKEQEMPKSVTFLEMFGVGRIEQLNPLKRWQENNPVTSLAAPVGVSKDGSLFFLDLHEKRQGPHGLVAGMTGSGKSEFLISYILSMAVNYHPDEVAFVLIDYKGGGLAGAFENPQTGIRLPHLVGTITNLDGASVERSLMSIESELRRRQLLFNEVKSSLNEGTMDIYTYQKLYRAGKVERPVPHLFIISDEFAELKQQQPEFMEKLVSAARIGRSLGVHLILATQRPSGVVDDQIRSNTKFRVCLRVQDRQDSMDMLKRPEAAEITDTGRFYLQVGYNEYFAMGQSAWSGASYEPANVVKERKDNDIEFLDNTGQRITVAKFKPRKTSSGKKQIVAIVEYLSKLAESQNISRQLLWEKELPNALDIDKLNQKYPSAEIKTLCLGMLDDPENQKQFPLYCNLASPQNMLIVGESGSGKSILIQSILLTMSQRLSPKEFQFYALDYSSRMLKLFKPLPHCGAVLQEEDELSLTNFFDILRKQMAERKRLFSTLEVDNYEAALRYEKLPLILVIIDNLAGFTASKTGEKLAYDLPGLLKDSARYGIKYLISSAHVNDFTTRIRQELGERICFNLPDRYSYGEILNCKVDYVPPNRAGRGLINVEGRPLEFQMAAAMIEGDARERTEKIKKLVAKLAEQYGGEAGARHLPVFDENAEYEDFSGQFSKDQIPLGYAQPKGTPVAIPFKQCSALSIYIGNPQGMNRVLDNMVSAAKSNGMELWIVKRQEHSRWESLDSDNIGNLPMGTKIFTHDQVTDLRTVLMNESDTRSKSIQAYGLENGFDVEAKSLYNKAFDKMRTLAKPVMLLFERFADFCKEADLLSVVLLTKYLETAQTNNIYPVAFFEPDDDKDLKNRSLYSSFNPERIILMLGGRFDRQTICPITITAGAEKTLPYNKGIMYYRESFHPIAMPCGEIEYVTVDDAEKNIFEDK